MIVQCPTCRSRYDDADRWTICPHGPLWAPSGAYCMLHDLVNCTICVPIVQDQAPEEVVPAESAG